MIQEKTNINDVRCPNCGGLNPKETSSGALHPEACRCGYFKNERV